MSQKITYGLNIFYLLYLKEVTEIYIENYSLGPKTPKIWRKTSPKTEVDIFGF